MIRIILAIGVLALLITPSFAEEVTIPDLQEAVNSAIISKDFKGQLIIRVPNRPEFEQPLHSLVNRDLVVPTQRGLVFRPEVREPEIVAALVRHGMSIATETNKNKKEIEALKEIDQRHDQKIAALEKKDQLRDEQISILTNSVDKATDKAEGVSSTASRALWLSLIALAISVFLVSSTLRRVSSWQGKATPPADDEDEDDNSSITVPIARAGKEETEEELLQFLSEERSGGEQEE